jgi:hypothetical protein
LPFRSRKKPALFLFAYKLLSDNIDMKKSLLIMGENREKIDNIDIVDKT